jgi:hypothetical protein
MAAIWKRLANPELAIFNLVLAAENLVLVAPLGFRSRFALGSTGS